MARRPAVRASNARDFFEFFERSNPPLHAHLKVTLPAEVFDRMHKGVRTDWIPVELDGQLVDAVLKYLGAEGLKRAARRFLSESLVKSPMMRGMFEGVVRLFGVSVGGFLRVVPPALAQSYQECFTVTIERGEREALVTFDDIAPEILRFPAYGVIWEGIFLGIYDLANQAPDLDFKLSRTQRKLEARLRW